MGKAEILLVLLHQDKIQSLVVIIKLELISFTF
jgi:hypothetical protein